jgi:hypothetical protein
MAKPDPNKPITHINPPTQVPDRLPPLKPGTFDPKLPQDTEANPDKKPKKKPK